MGARRTRAGALVAAIVFDQAKHGYLANSVVVGGAGRRSGRAAELMR